MKTFSLSLFAFALLVIAAPSAKAQELSCHWPEDTQGTNPILHLRLHESDKSVEMRYPGREDWKSYTATYTSDRITWERKGGDDTFKLDRSTGELFTYEKNGTNIPDGKWHPVSHRYVCDVASKKF